MGIIIIQIVNNIKTIDSTEIFKNNIDSVVEVKATTSDVVESYGRGTLNANKDGIYHYSITPLNGDMTDWISTYASAKTNPQIYTKTLKEVCFYVSGI